MADPSWFRRGGRSFGRGQFRSLRSVYTRCTMRTALALALAVAMTALLSACHNALPSWTHPPPEVREDRDAATSEDRELMRSFVAFARSPTDATWRNLRLAPTVHLGLGRRLLLRRSASELRDPEAWTIDVKYFRAYGGPFSALRLLSDERGGPLHVSVGPHRHCVSPPVPPPQRVAALRRVSVQPSTPETCLLWFSVDVYVDDLGEVRAVTLDAWEP